MENNRDELQWCTSIDLTNRARGGIVIYLLAWLIMTLPQQVHHDHPEFFVFNSVILLILLGSRLAHYIQHRRNAGHRRQSYRRWLIWTILLGALHWGLMAAWVLLNEEYSELDIYMAGAVTVFGIAGTTALAIAREIRVGFPLLMLGPAIVALLIRAQREDLIVAALMIIALVYVYVTSKTAGLDYWQALSNRALAEQRAVEMERLSVTDPLTRLKNRSFFDHRFAEEWKRGDRQKTPLSILMLDLDHFKEINDNHGHLFGDNCLRQVAVCLKEIVHRETDLVARYGGEEFVILLPDTDAAVANRVGEKLRDAISAIELEEEGQHVALTCSVGGATAFPDFNENRELLLKQADLALYEAKRNGRNQYQVTPAAPVSNVGGV